MAAAKPFKRTVMWCLHCGVRHVVTTLDEYYSRWQEHLASDCPFGIDAQESALHPCCRCGTDVEQFDERGRALLSCLQCARDVNNVTEPWEGAIDPHIKATVC